MLIDRVITGRTRRTTGRTTGRTKRRVGLVTAGALVALGMAPLTAPGAAGATAPVGAGLTVTPGDLSFILKQIKISERHAATQTPDNPCGTLVGSGPNQVPDRITAYGVRTVDGTCNNLFAGRERYAAADLPFPRLTKPAFRDAEDTGAFGPPGSGRTSYAAKNANVVDSTPRTVSNLVNDQTSTNPAAVAAAAFPVRSQGNPGKFPCTTDPDPLASPPVEGEPFGCVPSHQTLFIPNVTTDVGLSPPYNSLFTFFGQFFDHGIDQTVKGGKAVFVPLKADDPLRTLGPDGKAGTGDEVPASQAFMVLTRAQNQPGPDGILGNADDVQDANNTDSPWVDQSQTYSSHASHQVFLREYAASPAGRPVSTGKLLGGLPAGQTYPGSPDGTAGMGTWAAVKKQAAELLGLRLADADATNVPMLATDPYGRFIPGPARGLPQYVTKSGLVEGDTASPVAVPADALHFDTPFLTDIAHNADPSPQDTDHNPATAKVAPAPDTDDKASADFAGQAPGTYDDEMLDAHFACGDGRCNENIALSAVHQVFHSEHDRLVDYIKNVLTSDTSAAGIAALPEWKPGTESVTSQGWNGERLFQAARFVTEMEYQHMVFEEFARKIQPAIRPFTVYSPDINPAVDAEFAHAVYRFGHSMLDDVVARRNADKSDNSVPLLTGFLNPPEYFDGGGAGTLTPQQAAGSIVMGSSDQVGNELDEFVTESLRSNLLGLPLDLAAINLARAREAGIPSLNDVRRQLSAKTNDGQLRPYDSWSDFGQHLKHPESLINFVAAYGTHPTVTGATTLAGKRAAAKAIVDPSSGATPTDPAKIPEDAADFMFGTGAWADAGGRTRTGLDDVDLWVGGLAEVTSVNGGLLGSTFNYVFQNQLENLQDGDRFYYLNRLAGTNLRAQVEGNSFSELVQRNTDGTNSLKADAFATADCKFQLANLTSPAAAGSFITGPGSVNDDKSTPCNENRLLLQKPDGTIQYRAVNSVDPAGLNGQSVYNGTGGVDRVTGGNDNDTFWGGDGKDRLDGNGGDDVALGGDGSDVLTDLDGADVSKGGPGNDAIDTGPGNDVSMGGDGQDFMNGGANDNEAFAGPGDDFMIAGLGADAAFGDGGDDWIQGGLGQDLLIGDHGAPFFDDPAETAPGNDVFVGQPGENDYDAEGGDDVMAQNAGVDRNAGAGGYDWAIHQYDTVAADDDMEINNFLAGTPIQVVVNRDRWQETEASSGSAFDDRIKGTNTVPSTVGGAGFTGCNALDQAGVNRIKGLSTLLPQPLTGDLAPVVAASAAGRCPLTGPIWGAGNILLGGAGDDTIEGRGGDDIIEGDQALNVRISVRANPDGTGAEIGSTDLMERPYLQGSTKTLQQAVFDGTVDPGQLVTVREIVDAPGADSTSVDTAVFSGPMSNYSVGSVGGKLTVTQTGENVVGQKADDGTDTLTNVEALKFSDQTLAVNAPAAPVIGTATGSRAATGTGSATVTWTPGPNEAENIGYEIVVSSGGSVVRTETGVDASTPSATVTGLTNGTAYTFAVRAVNRYGAGPLSAPSNEVTPVGLAGSVAAPTATRGNQSAALTWKAPASNGGSPVTGYKVQVRTGTTVVKTVVLSTAVTSTTVTGLTNGKAYNFRVAAVNALGTGAYSASSAIVTPATVPGAPVILAPTQGAAGGTLTANANWGAPTATGGSAITGYRVTALKLGANGTTTVVSTQSVGATVRTKSFTLTAGSYKFRVVATNAVGASANSATSASVTPR